MRTIFEILLLFLILSVCSVMIAENRHPLKTLCWMLVICLLPVLGLILWFIFGSSSKNKRLMEDKHRNLLKSRVMDNYA